MEGLKKWIALLATITLLLLSMLSGLISAAPVREDKKQVEEQSTVEDRATSLPEPITEVTPEEVSGGEDAVLEDAKETDASDEEVGSKEAKGPDSDDGRGLTADEGMEATEPAALSLGIEPVVPEVTAMASVTPVLFPDWTSGNAEFECDEAGCDADYAYKIDAAAPNGTYDAGHGNTITISNSNGKVFDWSSVYPVGCVIVKASTAAYVYYYGGAYSDTGLSAPYDKDISHVTFCFYEPEPVCGSICGTKWEDVDCDGQGDQTVAGITIELYDASGAKIDETQTDENGDYCFSGLAPGDYTVKEVLDPGWCAIDPASGERHVTLGSCDGDNVLLGILCCPQPPPNVTGVDFLNARYKICGTKWEDVDGDGQGDQTVAGITIELYDASGAKIDETQTDENGDYCFSGLAPGDYTVKEVLDPGWCAIDPASGERHVTLGCADHGVNGFVGIGILCCPRPPQPCALHEDFVNARNLSICGQKWEDYTCDGVGDIPVDGVKIVLLDDEGTEIDSTVTADGGKYCFEGLLPGTYTVQEELTAEQLAIWYPKNPASGAYEDIELVCGQPIEGLDFVNSKYVEVCGYKFLDANCNGIMDEGEEGIPNVKILLWSICGVQSTWTDANGYYCFEGLKPGLYKVWLDESTVPEGHYHTTCTWKIFWLRCGEEKRVDFGNAEYLEVCGYKFLDANCNGIMDEGEEGIPNVKILLWSICGVQSTWTDANGYYCFEGLKPGLYKVWLDESTVPEGHYHTTCTWKIFWLRCGEDKEVNFGNARYLSICGQKWEDYTCDGEGDVPVDGVKIVLEDDEGTEIASTVTADGGKYCFDGLKPGTYTVYEELTEEQLAIWYPKNPASGAYEDIVLVCNQDIEGLDFVNSKYLSICGHKYEICDDQEIGVEGVLIELWQLVENGAVEVVASNANGGWVKIDEMVTEADGSYCFDGLKPGTYLVKEVLTEEQAEVWYFVLPEDGEQEVTLRCGESAEDVDFINARYLSICGQKWEDYTCDGEGDEPVDGVTIVLLDSEDNEIARTETADGGKYCFEDLKPGTYTVYEELTEEQLAVWYPKNPDTGAYEDIELVCCEPIEGLDFVNSKYLSISGTKWEDVNANGEADGTEDGVPGVTIVLLDAEDNLVETTTTDADGNYSFTGLKPGTYTVQEELTEEQLAEWYIVFPDEGIYDDIELVCDADIEGLDFFNCRYRNITGFKYNDANTNGTLQDGEVPWNGTADPITVELYQDGNLIQTTVIDNPDGMYEFTGLLPGKYTIVEIIPADSDIETKAPTSIEVELTPDSDLVVEQAFLNYIVEAGPIIIEPDVIPEVGPQQLPATGLNQLPLVLAAASLILLGLMALMLGLLQLRRS